MDITSASEIIFVFKLGSYLLELRFVTVQDKFDLHLAIFFFFEYHEEIILDGT